MGDGFRYVELIKIIDEEDTKNILYKYTILWIIIMIEIYLKMNHLTNNYLKGQDVNGSAFNNKRN